MQKILAIDDDVLFLEVILDLLEEKGFQGTGAQNGRLGLQLAKEHRPDLILCDIRMPGLSGYEVLMALRREPVTEKIPVIFLTGEQTDSDRARAMELGANDYLTKLCSLDQLVEAIKAQLK